MKVNLGASREGISFYIVLPAGRDPTLRDSVVIGLEGNSKWKRQSGS